MHLTTKSEYSLLALIYIARHERERYIKIEDICGHYGLPKKYLEQLLIIMKQNRIIRAKRGAHGGYGLTKPARTISVAQVFRMMDGALAPTESVSTYFFAHTPLEKEKKVLGVLKEIRNYIAKRLERLSLADLV